MKYLKKLRWVAIVSLGTVILAVIFAYSYDDVEPVCQNKPDEEVFLLNYVTKANLKKTVYAHNKGFSFKGAEFTRVYLLSYIFEVPDPVWDTKVDYRKEGCENMDSGDVYCIIRYSRLPGGKIDVWYNLWNSQACIGFAQ